jgi:hypothetical protein
MNYRVMPALTLSTGVKLLSEHVKAADYYPRGSRRNNVFFDNAFARHDGALTRHEQDFLYIRVVSGAAHVRGEVRRKVPPCSNKQVSECTGKQYLLLRVLLS